MSNPFKYTSRTFQTLLTDLNNIPSLQKRPEWFKRMICGIGDTASMWLNAGANDAILSTAFTRRSVEELTRMLDYYMTGVTASSGTVLYYIKNSASFPFTLAVADQRAFTEGSLSVSSLEYQGRSSINVAAITGTFTADHTTEQLTVSRDFITGEKVLLTSLGTLPAGLSAATSYYAIRISATVIQLADSIANAYAGTAVTFTDNGSGAHSWNLYSIRVTSYQQQSKEDVNIGESDGLTEWQEFNLPDNFILPDTLSVENTEGTWTQVDSFIDSISTDRHYKFIYNRDGSSKIVVGNGTYGKIPGNFDFIVSYGYGGGSNSNIDFVNQIILYGGNASQIESVSNATAMTGGANLESIEQAKILAPLLLKARGRFITEEDGEALVLNYGGISQVKVNKNTYGVNSCQVVAVASGGGNPSSAVRTVIQEFLIDRTILKAIDVRFEEATITAQNVTSAIKVLSGYSYADVEPFFTLAWQLFFTETGKEIYDLYINEGIADAVDFINTKFSASFTALDYTQIIKLLTDFPYRQFGDTIQQDDAIAFIRKVDGIDYMTISAPSFPIALAIDEIATIGTLTLTEIP